MFKTTRTVCFFTALLLTHAGWARFADDARNYWLCASYDVTNKTWVAKSAYERVAANNALDACKKESLMPQSCHIAVKACKASLHGVSSSPPQWKCTALDDQAVMWKSNAYPQQDDASLAALAYCKERSASPDSCYVNDVTCRNINATP